MEIFETKYDLLNAAYSDNRIKKGTLTLFQYLVNTSNDKGCFPAVDTIAEALSCCRRTVQNNMRKLEKYGYIIRKERWYDHHQLSNCYSFNLGIKEEKKVNWTESYNDLTYDMFDNDTLLKNGFRKANIVSWIFSHKLSTREKLLMIYCVHKSNQIGIMYDSVSGFCNALGICERTLRGMLSDLRRCGMIRIKTIIVNGRKCYAIQITGQIERKEKKNREEHIYNKRTEIMCSQEELIRILKTDKTANKKDCRDSIVENTRKDNQYINPVNIIYRIFIHVRRKLRKILRI